MTLILHIAVLFVLHILTVSVSTSSSSRSSFDHVSGRFSISKSLRSEIPSIQLNVRSLESRKSNSPDNRLQSGYLKIPCSLGTKFSFYGLPINHGLPADSHLLESKDNTAQPIGKGIRITHSYIIVPTSSNYEWDPVFVNITHIFHALDPERQTLVLHRTRQSPSSIWLTPKHKIDFDNTPKGPGFIQAAKSNPMVYSGIFALVMIFIYPYLNETAQAEKKKLKEEMRRQRELDQQTQKSSVT